MTKKIQCENKKVSAEIRVKLIKAPLVDSRVLRHILSERAKAIVL